MFDDEKTIASIKEGKTQISITSWSAGTGYSAQIEYSCGFWEKFKRIFSSYEYSRSWVDVNDEQLDKFADELRKSIDPGDNADGVYFSSSYTGNKVHLFPCSCSDFAHSILSIKEPYDDEDFDDCYEICITGTGYVNLKDRIFSLLKKEPLITREIVLSKEQVQKLILVLNERPTSTSITT